MRRRLDVIRSFTAFSGIVALVFSTLIVTVSAATSSGANSTTGAGNGIKISPVHSDLTIKPGSSATIDVYVTNVTAKAANFQVILNDFTAGGNESGNPAVILNPNESAPSHGLKKYMEPVGNIAVEAQETKNVKIVIDIPTGTAGGGYYGAIRIAPAGATNNNGKNITLSASVASLVLVKVPGDIKEQVSIASLDARVDDKSRSIFTSKKNIQGVVRFQNEGNIQEQPFGKLQIKNITGKTVQTVEINNTDPRGNVLPDSIRKFSVPLKGLSSFGRYTVSGSFGYGSNGQLVSANSTFYIIPIPVLIVLVLLVVAIIVAIFELPRAIKRYNKRVLRKAGRE